MLRLLCCSLWDLHLSVDKSAEPLESEINLVTFSSVRGPPGFADDDLQRARSDLVESNPATSKHGLEQGPVLAEGEVQRYVGGVAVGEVGVEVDAEDRAGAHQGWHDGPDGVDEVRVEL